MVGVLLIGLWRAHQARALGVRYWHGARLALLAVGPVVALTWLALVSGLVAAQ